MDFMSEQQAGGDELVQVYVPRDLVIDVYEMVARRKGRASGAARNTDHAAGEVVGAGQNMIDLIIEVARRLKADQQPVALSALHDAYLLAYPRIGKGQSPTSFGATVNYYTINMRSRFVDKNDRRRPAPWLAQPAFKRVARAKYMLLSDEEIARFNRCVASDDPLVYTDEYDVDDLAPGE